MWLETLILILHSLFAPLFILLSFFIPLLRRRLRFEKKNLDRPESVSFLKRGETADLCFEVSSEGELEQVRTFIEGALAEGKKIELIICSPSVERGALKLWENNPTKMRILRLPLVHFSWFFAQSVRTWMSAPTLIFCRYDFFPELVYLMRKKKSILMAATLKNKKTVKGRLLRIYRHFNEIYTSTEADKKQISMLVDLTKTKVDFLELRFLSIQSRFLSLDKKLELNRGMSNYKNWLTNFVGRKLVLGNFWPLEVRLLQDQGLQHLIREGKIHVAIFPHLLDEANVRMCKTVLTQTLQNIPVYEVKSEFTTETNKPGIALVLEKGFLCEFYHFYDDAYVGGGFGRSIHSALEPYLGGCRLYLGPKTHRSTEFDLVKETSPHEIFLLAGQEQFAPLFLEKTQTIDRPKRESMLNSMQKKYEHAFQEKIR